MGGSVRPTNGDAATQQVDQADRVTTTPLVAIPFGRGYERGCLRGYGDLLRDQWQEKLLVLRFGGHFF